jgi:hypothetical protein
MQSVDQKIHLPIFAFIPYTRNMLSEAILNSMQLSQSLSSEKKGLSVYVKLSFYECSVNKRSI